MTKRDKKTKVKKVKDLEIEYTEEVEDDDYENYPSVPKLKVDLKVLSEGQYFCLLKDSIGGDVFSVEKGIQGIYLNLLQRGRV